jgi:hypothetical protein
MFRYSLPVLESLVDLTLDNPLFAIVVRSQHPRHATVSVTVKTNLSGALPMWEKL